MQTGAGNLTASPQARHRAAARGIHGHAAHVIMCRRAHRDGLDCRIDSGVPAMPVNSWEALGESGAKGLPGVKVDTMSCGKLLPYGPGYDVARCQLAARRIA
ncbi:hypothetical protein X739_33675 [Mesorhizobium sp. LNHC220B00]|nr:hypothetical protein X739_33675 [Mesorhizobium sp. LNHC220B00]